MIRRRSKAEGRASFCLFFHNPVCIQAFLLTALFWFFPYSGSAQTPLSGFNPATIVDAGEGMFIEANVFGANNVFALRSLILDKWDGHFKPNRHNTADACWKADSGVIYKRWRVAVFYRGELFIKTNKDTVEILRMVNLKQDLSAGRNFAIDLKANGFSAAGLEVSRGFPLDGILKGLSAGFTARYLRGEKIQSGTISGRVTPEASKSYDFELFLDYVYDENYVYERRDEGSSFSGDGHSLDFGLRYNMNDRFNAGVLIRDVMGRIYWRNIPYTTADATSKIKSYDEDGYQQFRPTIRGYESHKDYMQRIPLKTDIDISYALMPFVFGSTVNIIENRPLYWLSVHYHAADNFHFSVKYNANYEAFSAGLAYRAAKLEIYSSDVRLGRANAAGLTASLRYEW